jgi:hypothetical protein
MYLYRPDGNQVLYSGRTVDIIWELNNWSPEYGGVLIDYSTDAGSTWQRIDSVPYRSRVDSVAWVVPDDTTSNGVIRVFTSDSMAFARTVKLLTIRPEPSIRVLRPSGGETFLIDSLVWIVWRAESIAGHLTIEYSVDGGAYWYTIESRRDIRAGLDSLGWSVAPPLGSATIIRITHDEGELGDTTDAFATVAVLAAPEESVGDSPSLRAHPQPAAGRSATLAWLQPEHGEVWLSVASADGTIVRSESLGTYPAGGARHRLDLTGVAAGVYHVTVVGGGTTITGSIVVVR